jgi:4-hydroxy-tetrahydrodipicolinate synthase
VRRWTHLVRPGGDVLDVACGQGRHLRWFASHGHRVTGVDRDASAQASPGALGTIVQADLEGAPWPLPGRTFDAVIVTNYLWRPGSIVALVTPMHEDGSVDYPALRKLIDWHIAEGTDCIGVVGTTGESPTVNVEEHCEIIRVSVEQAAGACPSWPAAAPTPRPRPSSWRALPRRSGRQPAAGGALLQQAHARRASTSTSRPLPRPRATCPWCSTTCPAAAVADMQHDTVLRLAQVPGIVGIKEATGNIERAQWLIRDLPKGFAVYSGDDPTAVALMLCGGHGNISVTANVAPRLMHELCVAALAGDVRRAMDIQFQLMPVHKQPVHVEANPIPVKWAMARMGLFRHPSTCPRAPGASLHDACSEHPDHLPRPAACSGVAPGRVTAGGLRHGRGVPCRRQGRLQKPVGQDGTARDSARPHAAPARRALRRQQRCGQRERLPVRGGGGPRGRRHDNCRAGVARRHEDRA